MDKKKVVRDAYGEIAQKQEGCGCGTCGLDSIQFAKSIGYSEEELKVIPDEANLALSCGNPTALASLKEGEVVLDLGSGAGYVLMDNWFGVGEPETHRFLWLAFLMVNPDGKGMCQ